MDFGQDSVKQPTTLKAGFKLKLSLQGDLYEEREFLMVHCNLDVIEEALLHANKCMQLNSFYIG